LTLLKAGYIVMVFMHLGDERKWLRNVILIPYTLFILYLIFIALWEALAIGDAWMAA
jgi:cytochrome c oxidase subunit 4